MTGIDTCNTTNLVQNQKPGLRLAAKGRGPVRIMEAFATMGHPPIIRVGEGIDICHIKGGQILALEVWTDGRYPVIFHASVTLNGNNETTRARSCQFFLFVPNSVMGSLEMGL